MDGCTCVVVYRIKSRMVTVLKCDGDGNKAEKIQTLAFIFYLVAKVAVSLGTDHLIFYLRWSPPSVHNDRFHEIWSQGSPDGDKIKCALSVSRELISRQVLTWLFLEDGLWG